MVDAVVLTGVTIHVERQVNGLAYFALLEQRSIALGRHLNDLILCRAQLQQILTRLLVGIDGQRVAGHIDMGNVFVGRTEIDIIAGRLHVIVVLLANEVGGVVALQLHHNLDGVAQVVLRQTLSERLAALNIATNHAATQCHSCRIPEIDS